MKQLSGFLLMLVLTGPFVHSKTHSPATPIIPYFEKPNAAGKKQELNILQGESLRIYLFCDLENLNTEKVWCKEELLKACLPGTNPVIFSEPEWNVLTMASNKKVRLGASRKGCATVHLTNAKVEDSGLYWFGLLNDKKIEYLSPIKMVVHKVYTTEEENFRNKLVKRGNTLSQEIIQHKTGSNLLCALTLIRLFYTTEVENFLNKLVPLETFC